MTTEEIEKAAEDYAKRLDYSMEAKHNMCIADFEIAFKKGAQFVNNNWLEKTRWIPVEERLPDRDKHVLWKTQGNGYFVMKLGKDTNFEWFKTHAKVTHWREIE